MARIRLNQTQSLTNNIFHHFVDPVWGTTPTATILGTQYLGNHSGRKIISPLVALMLEDNEDEDEPLVLTTSQLDTLAELIQAMFKRNWQRLWDVYLSEYEPMDPYHITEHKEGNDDYVRDLDTTSSTTSSNTSSSSSSDENSTSIYGYDSASPSNADRSNSTSSANSSNSSTNSNTYTSDETNNRDYDYDLTRSGNIGNTLNQEMLEAELRLWRWKFWDQVFADIDTVLTIDKY